METVSGFTCHEQVNIFEPGEICPKFDPSYRLNNLRYTLSESVTEEGEVLSGKNFYS